jgi:hypothetical protein
MLRLLSADTLTLMLLNSDACVVYASVVYQRFSFRLGKVQIAHVQSTYSVTDCNYQSLVCSRRVTTLACRTLSAVQSVFLLVHPL